MPLDSDEMMKIQNEATLGVEPSNTTPEALEFRRQVEVEIKQAVDRGLTPHTPYEL